LEDAAPGVSASLPLSPASTTTPSCFSFLPRGSWLRFTSTKSLRVSCIICIIIIIIIIIIPTVFASIPPAARSWNI